MENILINNKMENLEQFRDNEMTDQLGFECYKGLFKIIKQSSVTRKIETENHSAAYHIREEFNLQRGETSVYENVEFFVDGYVAGMDKFYWDLPNELSSKVDISKADLKLVKSIPLIEIDNTKLCIKVNGLWKLMIVCNNKFVILLDI